MVVFQDQVQKIHDLIKIRSLLDIFSWQTLTSNDILYKVMSEVIISIDQSVTHLPILEINRSQGESCCLL